MKPLLLVALGGSLGSVTRYLLSVWVTQRYPDWRFPVGTFIINVAGCMVIGFLSGFAVKQGAFSTNARLFLFTGVLGGFTTFSAFGLETFHLLRRGEPMVAGAYVVLSVIVGLLAVAAGFSFAGARP
jgi:CrcB protein